MAPYSTGTGDVRLTAGRDTCPTCRGLGAMLVYEPYGAPEDDAAIPVGRVCPVCHGEGVAHAREE